MPSFITHITAAQRLDSRGNPTVQVTLTTDKGSSSNLLLLMRTMLANIIQAHSKALSRPEPRLVFTKLLSSVTQRQLLMAAKVLSKLCEM